mgnify:CR=1 FL=1
MRWEDSDSYIGECVTNEHLVPDGFGSIRDIIEKSVKSYGWIHLEDYNDNGDPPIVLAGSN